MGEWFHYHSPFFKLTNRIDYNLDNREDYDVDNRDINDKLMIKMMLKQHFFILTCFILE